MESKAQLKVKKESLRSAVVLNKNLAYPSKYFDEVADHLGRLYLGESLTDAVRGYSDENINSVYDVRGDPSEWTSEINANVRAIAGGSPINLFMDFVGYESKRQTISAHLVTGFLRVYDVKLVICLQEPDVEIEKNEFRTYKNALESVGIDFISYPIPDHKTVLDMPGGSSDKVSDLDRKVIREIVDKLAEGHSVYIHCKGGQGRSGQIAAAAMCRLYHKASSPMGAEQICKNMATLRKGSFTRDSQDEFMAEFAKQLNVTTTQSRDTSSKLGTNVSAEVAEERKKAWQQAVEAGVNGEDSDAMESYASSYLGQGEPNLALLFYDAALHINPRSVPALNGKSGTLAHLHHLKEASDTASFVLEIDPKQWHAYNTKADALIRMGEPGEAIWHCDKAIKVKPDFAIAYITKAEAYFELGEYDKAKELAAQAYQMANTNQPAAKKVYDDSETMLNTKPSLEQFEVQLKADPRNPDLLNSKADKLNIIKNHTEALKVIDEALAINPSHTLALATKGEIYQAISRHTDAMKFFNLTVNDPQYGYIIRNLKQKCQNELDGHSRIYQNSKQKLASYPDNPFHINNQAFAHVIHGQPNEAIELCDKGLKLRPNDYYLTSTKAEALEALAKYKEAIQLIDLCLETAPGEKYLLAFKERLIYQSK